MYDPRVKVKRTYQLSRETVEAVRELVGEKHAAVSQDALVEAALRDYIRRRRDAEDAEAWAMAAGDPDLTGEAQNMEVEFRSADRETWPV